MQIGYKSACFEKSKLKSENLKVRGIEISKVRDLNKNILQFLLLFRFAVLSKVTDAAEKTWE